MHTSLELVLLLLGLAVIGVALFRLLQLPPILGYLVVGLLVGPHTPGVVVERETLHALSEFGVVFLMFSIGLEFSYPKLKAMRRIVFGLGMSQVVLSIVFVMALCFLGAYFVPKLAAVSWQAGFAIGGALAMSSTAIVSKLLSERMELETEHGRRIFGVLLFQDLALVPLLILVPALTHRSENVAWTLGMAFVKGIVVMALLLFIGQKLIRWWLNLVVRRRSQELFMLNLLLLTLGSAWITKEAGLSLELGAFMAGMLISETQYKHQVEVDIQSFRDVLMGLFFVTIGMLLDFRILMEYWWLMLPLLLGSILFKFALVASLSRFFGASPGTSIRTGIALAQAGEFGFVLLNQADGLQLLHPVFVQLILVSMVLSMFAAPFLIAKSDAIVMKLCANEWMMQSLALTNTASRTIATEKHVIIAGFGRTGQSLAKLLEEQHIPYHALDLDPERVHEASAAGAQVSYGDASRRESLVAAGIHRAAVLVITFAEAPAAERVMHFAHEIAPVLPIIVRSFDGSDFDRLKKAGATEIVPEAIESSMVLALFTIRAMGMSTKRVLRIIQDTRKERYASLRSYFRGSESEPDSEELVRLHSITLPEGAQAVGKNLGAIDLSSAGTEVIMVRRGKERLGMASDLVLQAGDVLVVRGTAGSVDEAERKALL
ncbi:MAG: potassium transporter [Oxalobacter sp.]|nr:MAG: potassium transporter [Oxalobacter sp.]